MWHDLQTVTLALVALGLGVVLFLRTPPSRAARTAVADALRALRGVLPPLAVVAIAGALTTPRPVAQVLVCASLGAILAHWGYEAEWRFAFEGARHRRRSYGLLGVAVAGVVLGVVLAALLTNLPQYDDSGGLSAAFALTALIVGSLALVVRLVGYARHSSWWRWLPVVLALGLVVRVLALSGVFTERMAASTFPSLSATIAAFAIGFATSVLVEALRSRVHHDSTPSEWSAAGLGLSVASA